MNTAETTRLCRAIASLAPSQHLDEETPAIWSVVLAWVRYEDARQAVVAIAARQAYIAPADIVAEVRRARSRRLEHADAVVPDADPDDPAAYLAALRSARRAIADGADPPRQVEAPPVRAARPALPGPARGDRTA